MNDIPILMNAQLLGATLDGRQMSAQDIKDHNDFTESVLQAIEGADEWLAFQAKQPDEHPDDYDGPCFCKLCMSYNDG